MPSVAEKLARAMSWEVWSQVGRRGVQWSSFESEREARGAFHGTWCSSVLIGPDGVAVDRKLGLLDFRHRFSGSDANEILAERSRILHGPRWLVGVHVRQAVRWASFASEAAAQDRYGRIPWSKVLFGPDGAMIKCSTARFDAKGVGVAGILRQHRCGGDRAADRGSIVRAIESGDVPYVPRERSALVRQALKLVVRAAFNRASVTYFSCGPHKQDSLCYFDAAHAQGVQGHVALTLDDAPCRFGRENSMVQRVRELLHRHGARATFMVVGRFTEGHEPDLVDLLRDGHELGNHGMLDRPYHADSVEDFTGAIVGCSTRIQALQRGAGVPEGVRWFRAPCGKYTEAMAGVLAAHGLINVMCDTYACCPVIQDGNFIGRSLAERARDGSIILLHMPEVGTREWCLAALERLLDGLGRRGLRVVTVSELARQAGRPAQGA